ncbi:MAG TPA: glycosyltransferase [Candidatus Udaeobacter sp.]|nr:glycosyltransferase [Candidatus Udaeobacter sp.]
MSSSPAAPAAKEVLFLLKGYPRLSETFIAQEIRALEQRGLSIRIVALRRPTDRKTHPVVSEIQAPVSYLPEYLWREPWRVLGGWRRARRLPGYPAARRAWLADLRRDPTVNRGRRFGQALVLAAELPASIGRIHAHFLHTPASVARYAALMTGWPWSASAHAKDIWTTPDWEKTEKIASCQWLATCSAAGAAALSRLAAEPGKVILARHGLDLARFPVPEGRRPPRDGSDPTDPVVILSVGRAVEKKGYDDLLAALALLPSDLAWRLVHVGGGPLLKGLRRQARVLGLEARIDWKGPQAQAAVLAELRAADLFVLASRTARDGDRDGLPNVLMEAGSQGLALLATRAGAIEELIVEGETGLLVPPRDPAAMAAAIARLVRDPALRRRLGASALSCVRRDFDMAEGIERLAREFGLASAGEPAILETASCA